jgi:putative ABC transport system ATP-binding protein
MMHMLRGLASQTKRPLVVVTHGTRMLEFSDRVARMEDGRIIDVRAAADLGSSP